MQEAEYRRKETSFDEVGDDGELSGAMFCTTCGSLNDVGAEMCKSCDAVLAEQGNHLSARLRRISRRAYSVHLYDEPEPVVDDKPSENVSAKFFRIVDSPIFRFL